MNGFLLDTNVPSELTRPRSNPHVERWLEDAKDDELYLSAITIGEVLKGVTLMPAGKRREAIQRWLDDILRPWFYGRILPVTIEIAERWGVLAGECHDRPNIKNGRWLNRGYSSAT